MKIEVFKGSDRKVIELIGPYAMNPDVIREMKGYPILTNKDIIWFIAFEKGQVVGFSSCQIHNDYVLFTNDYTVTKNRESGIHSKLIEVRLEWCKENGYANIKADCTKPCARNYIKHGFKIVKEFKDWIKVKL